MWSCLFSYLKTGDLQKYQLNIIMLEENGKDKLTQ